MHLAFTPEELAFRDEVREFLAEEYPQDILQKVRERRALSKDDIVRGQQALYQKGWAAVSWPVEHGGTGWNPTQKYIFEEEYARANCPRFIPFGMKMVGPVIYTFGTEEQKQRFLPDILSSNAWWCQGYSETGAGSDLATLKTKAELDGDDYVVNGQKTWTTQAQHADWMFCLVRTDASGKPQQGITFLLIDMKSPGITVDPIITLEGSHEVNSVFLDNVRVPRENMIGEEGKGWTYAKYLLTHERTNQANVARTQTNLADLKQFLAAHPVPNEHLMARCDQVEMDLSALEMTELRTLAVIATGGAPGAESSMLKIKGTELMQAVTELWRETAAYYELSALLEYLDPDWSGEGVGPQSFNGRANEYFNQRKLSIYGGSNEIQKNIIAKQVLDL